MKFRILLHSFRHIFFQNKMRIRTGRPKGAQSCPAWADDLFAVVRNYLVLPFLGFLLDIKWGLIQLQIWIKLF
ncbi:hypothetical protein D3C81_1365610 [compost metagenome]